MSFSLSGASKELLARKSLYIRDEGAGPRRPFRWPFGPRKFRCYDGIARRKIHGLTPPDWGIIVRVVDQNPVGHRMTERSFMIDAFICLRKSSSIFAHMDSASWGAPLLKARMASSTPDAFA